MYRRRLAMYLGVVMCCTVCMLVVFIYITETSYIRLSLRKYIFHNDPVARGEKIQQQSNDRTIGKENSAPVKLQQSVQDTLITHDHNWYSKLLDDMNNTIERTIKQDNSTDINEVDEKSKQETAEVPMKEQRKELRAKEKAERDLFIKKRKKTNQAVAEEQKHAVVTKAPIVPREKAFLPIEATTGRTEYNSVIGDVMFTVKTAEKLWKTRTQILLDTWISVVKNQTYVITDTPKNKATMDALPIPAKNLIVTKCRTVHNTIPLRCKMGYELEAMANNINRYRWFCRADDDTYYNTKGIVKVLNKYNWTVPVIIGKANNHPNALRDHRKFDYPLGNAGVCMSRALLRAMAPYVAGRENYEYYCATQQLNDDVCLGVAAYQFAGARIHQESKMHEHGLFKTHQRDINDFVTVNFRERHGVVHEKSFSVLSPAFDLSTDPTRLYSVHCHLYPSTHYCAPLFPDATLDTKLDKT